MSTGIYKHKSQSEQTKAKISAALVGKKKSEAAKLRMRKPDSRWSSFNIRHCECGKKLYRGSTSLLCGLCTRQKLLSGKNHYNWKGGITEPNKKLRNSLAYKLWRKAVFERDNYTCQTCKKRGVYLEADHIKPFALYPELRLEVSNGLALCKPCHELTPTYKGKIHSYVPQF